MLSVVETRALNWERKLNDSKTSNASPVSDAVLVSK